MEKGQRETESFCASVCSPHSKSEAEHTVNIGISENWHTVLLWQLLDGLMDDLTLCFINTACQKCTCMYFLCNKGKKLAVCSRDILQWYICPRYNPVKNASNDTVICGSKSILTLLCELKHKQKT